MRSETAARGQETEPRTYGSLREALAAANGNVQAGTAARDAANRGQTSVQVCGNDESSSAAMPVVEKFVSINGEGQCAGKLAAFIRFAGCNLRCSYCDTMWANEPGVPVQPERVEQLVTWVRTCGVECVTLTGGEPVLQPLLSQLVEALLAEQGPSGHGLRVEIETNGAADLGELAALRERLAGTLLGKLTFTVDWKLPSSGMENRMLPKNFRLLDMRDTVKFVCAESDLPRMLEVAQQLDLPGRVPVYVSPCFGAIEPARIVEFMQKHQMIWACAQLQLHKIIWPNTEKGV